MISQPKTTKGNMRIDMGKVQASPSNLRHDSVNSANRIS